MYKKQKYFEKKKNVPEAKCKKMLIVLSTKNID